MPLDARCALFLFLAGVLGAACARDTPPVAELAIHGRRIEVEVANTYAAQVRGLMHRTSLPEHRGMVFVYEDSRIRCMWMKNTPIPLSVAFIDQGGRILNIEDMQPDTRDDHCSVSPAQFALEMNRGWFRENGVKPGDTVSGLTRLPPWQP